MSVYALDSLMAEARRLAAQYRRTTGRTLPISQEIAVNDAVRLLGLRRAPVDALGYDASSPDPNVIHRYQIKGRAIFDTQKGGQRLGQLALDQTWEITLLVLMDDDYEPFEIHAAGRDAITQALNDAHMNRRGILSVARFKMVGALVWTRDEGVDTAAFRAVQEMTPCPGSG